MKIGIIGIGNIGSMHTRNILSGVFKNVELTALCDVVPEKLEKIKEITPENIALFNDPDEFFNSNLFDAVIVATPHYSHPELGIKALQNDYHTLIEKPIGVYTKQVKELYKAAANSDKAFGIVYNQRTNPIYKKVKELVDSGELGELRRINWIITDWYRNQAYYDSGSWRATWGGEGGGVLINQCPHQLDLWQWICGMPKRIRAFCHFGKRRKIEVEDDVTIYAEYDNGATAVFIASTSDCPGTNRLEITGDRGKIVVENDEIRFFRLREGETEYNERMKNQSFSSNVGFSKPEHWECIIKSEQQPESQHIEVMRDWMEYIHGGKDSLLAPGTDGINGLMISNAAYLSTFIDGWVELPLDDQKYQEELNKRTTMSKIPLNISE